MRFSRRTLLRLAGLAALGLGARGPHEVKVVAENLTGGEPEFVRILEGLRGHAGMA
jgi:hypothetical protein